MKGDEMFNIIKACHNEPYGEKFVYIRIAYNILHSKYF
jgi:hypothetical protein